MQMGDEQRGRMPVGQERHQTHPGSHYEPGFQRFTDPFVERVFLWAFPRWIRPNHLTFLRLALIPAVLVLWYFDLDWWALGVFAVAISTDFIDGTMARTRDQITLLGTYLDPVADKLLIGAVLAWIGWQYLIVQIVLAFIFLELLLTALGVRMLLRARTVRPSNAFGKTKMVVQSAALGILLLASILESQPWIQVGLALFWLALALAAVSGATQIRGVLSLLSARRPQDSPGGPADGSGLAGRDGLAAPDELAGRGGLAGRSPTRHPGEDDPARERPATPDR